MNAWDRKIHVPNMQHVQIPKAVQHVNVKKDSKAMDTNAKISTSVNLVITHVLH